MAKIDLGQTTQILANLGVIAGIVFLAVEVSQNQATIDEANRIALVTARYEALQHFNEIRYEMVRNDRLMEAMTSDVSTTEFAPADRLRADAYCGITIWNQATAYEVFRELGDRATSEGILANLRMGIENETVLAVCWPLFRERLLRFGFEELVQRVEQ